MPIFILWSITIILFLAFTFGILFLMTRGKRFMRVTFSVSFCVAIIGGFLFYSYNYISSGEGLLDTLYATVRGIFTTSRMFFINADYGALLTESIWLQILFWLCHLAALIVIQATLFTLFARKLVQNFRMRFGLHREVYIIKGSDKYALMLGENIATCDDPHKLPVTERLVVFLIEDDDMEKTDEKTAHFGGLVKVLDRKNDFRYYLSKAGLGERWQRGKKYSVILMQDNASVPDDAHLVADYAKERNVSKDSLNIFAFATSDWDREQIEFFTQKEGGYGYPCTFHIISVADLLIRRMIEKHPPFECPGLRFNESGVAERNFNVMILGFGTVGQQALLRLIMNGQFITRDGSRMRATVVDREMKHLEEHFRLCYPSLDICCDMEFLDHDVRDKAFFDLLEKSDDMDYFVVALSSNKENKKIARDIRLHYERKGLPFPFIAVSEKNERLHSIKHNDGIFTFGCKEETYTHSVIIREETNNMAKAVNETYKNMYGGQAWHELDWFTQESNRAAADFIPAMLKLANTTADKAENYSKLTNDITLAETLAQTEHLRWNAFHVVMGYRRIGVKEMRERFETYSGEKNSREHFNYCRKDTKARLHICLVSWDELDELGKAYNDVTGKVQDFKEDDRRIIENIPKFLKMAKSGTIAKGNLRLFRKFGG